MRRPRPGPAWFPRRLFRASSAALVGAIATAAAFGAGAASVAAADTAPTVDAGALDAKVREHVGAKEFDAAASAVRAVGKAYAAADEPGRKVLALSLQWAAKATPDETVRKAVIEAVGETKERSLAGVLRPFLAQPDRKVVPPLLKPAIEAAGKLADDSLVPLLLAVVKDSKNTDVAGVALAAFSGYGQNKRTRVTILREIVNSVEKDKPSSGTKWKNTDGTPVENGSTRSSDDSAARFQALGPVLVKVFNAMTGQNCGTSADCFALWSKYKSTPGDLFAN